MKTVFLSGSRAITRLNEAVRRRVDNMMAQGFHLVVGDANGADKALQAHLAAASYRNVTVFCAGNACRNNVGGWMEEHIRVDTKLSGREFYTQKDKAMAAIADCGLVLWDGKSAGSMGNVFELARHGKWSVVYLSPEGAFYNVKTEGDARTLLGKAEPDAVASVTKKIQGARQRGSRDVGQHTLGF